MGQNGIDAKNPCQRDEFLQLRSLSTLSYLMGSSACYSVRLVLPSMSYELPHGGFMNQGEGPLLSTLAQWKITALCFRRLILPILQGITLLTP
jgi:hypothetical protein